jgi:hypothetical protein
MNFGVCCFTTLPLHVWHMTVFHSISQYSWHLIAEVKNKCSYTCFLCAFVVCAVTILLMKINPLNPELNPICCLLALLGADHFLHVSRIRVQSLTLRLLMSFIYGAPILDVSRSHTTTHQSVGLFWTSDQLVAETST